MDRRRLGNDRRRHVPAALTGASLAWPLCRIKCILHSNEPIKGLAHLNSGTPEPRFPMNDLHMAAKPRRHGSLYRLEELPQEQLQKRLQKRPPGRPENGLPNPLQEKLDRAVGRARVYPNSGHFLNPVALSNIETYPMACGRSGTAPRFLFLRSSSGTLVIMQPPMKTAQSMFARLQPAGTKARTSR